MADLLTDADRFEAVDGSLQGRDGPGMMHHGGWVIAQELVGEGGKGMSRGYRRWLLVANGHSDKQRVELSHAIAARRDEATGLYSVCRVLDCHRRQSWVSGAAYHAYLGAGRVDGCSQS